MSAGILDILFLAGLKARVEAGRLLVSPADRITPALRQMIQASKADIMVLLKAAEAPEPGPGGFSSGDGITGEAKQ